MSENTTRRNFLKTAVAAGGCLAFPKLNAAAACEPRGSAVPLTVVTQDLSRDVNPRAPSWGYIAEILRRAGVFFRQISPSGLSPSVCRPGSIVLLAGELQLTSAQRDMLDGFVKEGGSLIGVGGTSGMDETFGVSGKRPLTEGWIRATASDHPLTSELRSSLHVYGGCAVAPGSAASLADLEAGRQGARGSTILENRPGNGRAVLLGPDLIFSVIHIQQGVPVLHDGNAAPDDSAPIDDGELKAEDGLVLDWQRDRTPMSPDKVPVFLEPVSDELRELILRSIFHVARAQGTALPVLWYWPRGLEAVGHISHDTDGNDPRKAEALLDVMDRSSVTSTWCTLYPGGYPRQFYEKLKQRGYEIALHYDARTGGEETSWSKQNLVLQHRWLLKEAGLEEITSNKNHYTRWEHRLDFFRWCEEVGIRSDQTRGPSKQGTIGFPLGGSQPYYPWDDEREAPRHLNVLEVNLLTQDLIVTCPEEYGRQLLDSAIRHHGVGHFLFHPNHVLKPGVAEAIAGLVDYGRSQRIEWWRNDEICGWEERRRGVRARFDSADAFTLSAERPAREATLLVLKTGKERPAIRLNNRPADATVRNLYGFDFEAVQVDIQGELKVQTA